MPGAVAKTSTIALTNVTVPYALQIAGKGALKAVQENEGLLNGVNIANGKITCKAVADALGEEYYTVAQAMSQEFTLI